MKFIYLFTLCRFAASFNLKSGDAFSPLARSPRRAANTLLRSIAVPISELEKDLTPPERSITSVVRNCGASVAFVTSVWPGMNDRTSRQSVSSTKDENMLPRGMSLGSGSGFVVSPGYLCTNYHVIERAYSIRKTSERLDTAFDQFSGNFTQFLPVDLVNATKSRILSSLLSEELPEVFVRIGGAKTYFRCRIVDVEPDLDLAVLKVETKNTNDISTVSFGSSSDLLVGQTVVAIGNPFGLDSTVTTGVVSAVNREFRAGTARTPANRPIRNCVQTDAAINPGNSGGPLLNLKGEVVGINTAIITTSGSNAGIGFAIPADQLRPIVDRIIREDRIGTGEKPDQGWLGVSIVKQSGNSTLSNRNWVASVETDSPADQAGILETKVLESGIVEWGDAIVTVGGNEVATFLELQTQLGDRIKGEQVTLTLENIAGERRVVYVTLTEKPA